MTNELSKQICEICGIEPETITVHRGFTKKEVEAYPDFGEPENFVNLLELKVYTTLWALVSKREIFVTTRIDFLKTLYLILTGAINSIDIDTVNLIKQAIREAQWKYE